MLTIDQINDRLPENMMLIGEYTGYAQKTDFKCKVCGTVIHVSLASIVKSKSACPTCENSPIGKKQSLTVQDVQERLPETVKIIGGYKTTCENANFKCTVCGGIWSNTPGNIFKNKGKGSTGCPFCAGKRPIKGKTDIATVYPDLVKYFVDVNDAYNYTAHSEHIVKMRCPECGKIDDRVIANVTSRGFHCNYCDDGVSYPNKYVRSVLSQTGIQFLTEYSVCGRLYDNYFEIDGDKYLVEVDGEQHYTNKFYSNYDRQRDDFEIDKEKDDIAANNGYILIRIDAFKSDPDYIKNSIINKTVLPSILDLSKVDYDLANKSACSSLVIKVIELYNNSVDIKTIAEMLKIAKLTVRKYLHKGVELGMCDYNSEKSCSKMIYCEETQSYYKTARIAAKILGLSPTCIGRVCQGKAHQTGGGFHFRYATEEEIDILYNLMGKELNNYGGDIAI